jgi:membrane-associated PAP2 superfamily phosphatase
VAVVASACAWLTFVVYDARSGSGPYLAYMAWTVPLALGLALRLLRGAHRLERMPAAAAPAPA